ncbi:MAG TPA: phosphatidate cytidylyltransferase [Stellaceae bacterium]|nr:phosphatidate cytidylyltransferase [Stellaceae bacterium]
MGPAEPSGSNTGALRLRILSALVLAPLPIIAIWFGGVLLAALTLAAAVIMAWEWGRLCSDAVSRNAAAVLIGGVAVSVAAAALWGLAAGTLLALAGAVIVWWVALHCHAAAPLWLAAGALWVALPCVILLWLVQGGGAGRGTLFWMFAVVWATDIGAFVVGRRLGGPLLAPRWSPRKTWAGLIGGVACAALAGWAVAGAFGATTALPLVLISAGLAIVEQFGDLAESVAKRRFGVKDASGLIPGHGGLLDRLDGLLAVIPAVALLLLFGGGSVLTWQ